ncbi:MAG: hypothetical protein ACK5LO_06940 [Leucobacter sp.]
MSFRTGAAEADIETSEAENLLWCIRPQLDFYRLRAPLSPAVLEKPLHTRIVSVPNHARYGSTLVATETVNQYRAVERLIGSSAETVKLMNPRPELREGIVTTEAVQVAQRRLRSALADRAADAVTASFEVQLQKLALALALYRATDLSAYSGVVIATQHAPTLRTLIVAANEQSVPVTYVPHAPVADNCAYLDLPTSYVGLRGRGEREFYANSIGARPELLDIVGNLATDVLARPLPATRAQAPGVLALSPDPPETLRRVFETLSGADLGSMIVAPHPRSNPDDIRELLPTGWSTYEGGRTLDLLAEGPPFVFQFSSGVAWESAALGIPTAEIRLGDEPVNYPFLADETVYPPVRNPEEARAFAERARAGEVDRGRLRRHAEAWCESDGDSAAQRLGALLDRVAVEGGSDRPQRVHDGWSSGGAALARSWIAATEAAPA